MQVVIKYLVILDHTSNKIDLCCDITSWTVCANDSIQGFALYTGTLPIFKCRYATRGPPFLPVVEPSSLLGAHTKHECSIPALRKMARYLCIVQIPGSNRLHTQSTM